MHDNPELPGRKSIYVGETENLYKRLSEHNKDDTLKDWDLALAFITKDQNLNKAHAKYLESMLIEISIKAKRATLSNSKKNEKR